MIRTIFLSALLALPLLASAQAIKCRDPATGKTLYTDQPCSGGELVVPARTADDMQRNTDAAAQARDDADRQERLSIERARQQLQAEQAAAAMDRMRAETAMIDANACRAARAEASFRSGSFSASEEEIRTARYNAALACGQQPPADVVVVQPTYPVYPTQRPRYNQRVDTTPVTATTPLSQPNRTTRFTPAPSRLDDPNSSPVVVRPSTSR
jgi:hypothetical protein